MKIKTGKIGDMKQIMRYELGTVFDISQTNAKESDYPKLFPKTYHFEHTSDLKLICKGLEKMAEKKGISVVEVENLGAIKGGYHQYVNGQNPKHKKGQIEINQYSSPSYKIRLLHELAHSRLHNVEAIEKNKKETGKAPSKQEKELQAEMTAYVVASKFGMDTEEESLPYMANWAKNGQNICCIGQCTKSFVCLDYIVRRRTR